MSGVRPVALEDLPAVVELYESVMRSGSGPAPPGLAPYFERTLLDHPWTDPEIPSLVYEGADGRIAGFVGAHVRRIEIDGRPGRLVCAGQLVAEPAARRRGAGTILLRDLFAGPQQLSITDGATPEVAAIWGALGGATVQGRSIAWMRVLRPAAAVGQRLLERQRWRRFASATRPLWRAADTAAQRVTQPAMPAELEPPAELDAATLVGHGDEIAPTARLRVAYDEPFVGWLLDEMAAVSSRGTLVRRAVRRGGRVVGAYIAYLQPEGTAQVVYVAAAARFVDAVLDELFAEAWRSGAAVLSGRIEPHLFESLSQRRCVLRPAERVLVHSHGADTQAIVAGGAAALSRIDGEWWMGHHLEPFDGDR